MKVKIQHNRKVWEIERSEVEVPDGTPHDQVEARAMIEFEAGRGIHDTPVTGNYVDDEVEQRTWWAGKPVP
jgi:hypothetical protein